MVEEKSAEVVSFKVASQPHVIERKEAKLKKMQKAFKAATEDRFKDAAKQRRKRKNSKKKKQTTRSNK